MQLKKAILIYTITLWLFSENVYSQSIPNDSAFHAAAVSNTMDFYHNQIGYQARLFNGSQYAGYPYNFKEGHPYFESDEFAMGSVVYDHVYFPKVLLLYNEVESVVLIRDQTHFTQLISDKISNFTIGKNNFIRIAESDNLKNESIKPGFYNILYSGKSRLLKQEIKLINKDISNASEGIKRSVLSKNVYFLEVDNHYFPIYKKKDLLNIFSGFKSEISIFIKKNNLNFNEDKNRFLIETTALFDQISK